MYSRRLSNALVVSVLVTLMLMNTMWCQDDEDEKRRKHEEQAQRLRQQALEKSTGVRIFIPDQVPKFFADILSDAGETWKDLGGGRFLWRIGGQIRFVTFVYFDITVENPCDYMIQNQRVKTYRFIKGEGTNFERNYTVAPHSSKGDPDPPPNDPKNNTQDPGELVDRGNGHFESYDTPGISYFCPASSPQKMPAYVTADRFRFVFRAEITCPKTGRVLKRFYWMIEITVYYKNGKPLPDQSTSSVKLISANEFENADEIFGKDHQ